MSGVNQSTWLKIQRQLSVADFSSIVIVLSEDGELELSKFPRAVSGSGKSERFSPITSSGSWDVVVGDALTDVAAEKTACKALLLPDEPRVSIQLRVLQDPNGQLVLTYDHDPHLSKGLDFHRISWSEPDPKGKKSVPMRR